MDTPAIPPASTDVRATGSGLSPVSGKRPMVIGLYGLPGSGKSALLRQIKLEARHKSFDFYEGSALISDIVPGSLPAFAKLAESERRLIREKAILKVAEQCLAQNHNALVAGHYMFWPEGEREGNIVATTSDYRVYTHIIYLDVPAATIFERRRADEYRERQQDSIEHLQKWQETEIDQLRRLCRQHGILFSVVPQHSSPFSFIWMLIRHFEHSNTKSNRALTIAKVNEALIGESCTETVLVVDADKTLAGDDAGSLFWQAANASCPGKSDANPLKTLFSGPLGYSEAAFRQATLLYEEAANERDFETLCGELAAAIRVHPEFIDLFQQVCRQNHIRVIVLTCGIRNVWQKVIDKAVFAQTIKVIGGGRIADEIVMTPELKAEIVLSLRQQAGCFVWAIGDSPVDLAMLGAADRAIVVSGEIRSRSRSMEGALCEAIDTRGLRCHQVLLPPHAAPRLDTNRLPILRFSDLDFVDAVLSRRPPHAPATVPEPTWTWSSAMVHATNSSAAKLLMSPMRDASVAGVELRRAHKEVGKLLALQFLTEMIGVEAFSMPHVQGHETTGFRLANDAQTAIVALMRGGEPMASGINKVFPKAMLLHAACAEDIKSQHLENKKNLLLVDSVVNSGKSIMEFIQHVVRVKKDLANIIVVAGVVQEEAVGDGHALRTMMQQHRVKMVALRVSSNRFTSSKTTDTGNRLFNTTHLV